MNIIIPTLQVKELRRREVASEAVCLGDLQMQEQNPDFCDLVQCSSTFFCINDSRKSCCKHSGNDAVEIAEELTLVK